VPGRAQLARKGLITGLALLSAPAVHLVRITPALVSFVRLVPVVEDTHDAVAEKVHWVREAAGDRFAQLELGVLVWAVEVTAHRRSSAEEIAQRWGLTADQVLASPYFLRGSVDAIVDQVQAMRDRHGISYLTVFPEHVDSFAPVVARLAGT